MLSIVFDLKLYICDTNPNKANHHDLHTNTAPYVVTTDPEPGDIIQYVLRGVYQVIYDPFNNNKIVGGNASLTLYNFQEKYNLILVSHLGRNVMLGEDGAEDAFDQDITAQLFAEKLSPYQKDWGYAPCSIKKLPGKPIYLQFNLTEQGWELSPEQEKEQETPFVLDL